MRHSDKDAGGECEEIYRDDWFLTQSNSFTEEKKIPYKYNISVKKENRR